MKLILTLTLAFSLQPLALIAGTNAAVTFNTNTLQLGPVGLAQSISNLNATTVMYSQAAPIALSPTDVIHFKSAQSQFFAFDPNQNGEVLVGGYNNVTSSGGNIMWVNASWLTGAPMTVYQSNSISLPNSPGYPLLGGKIAGTNFIGVYPSGAFVGAHGQIYCQSNLAIAWPTNFTTSGNAAAQSASYIIRFGAMNYFGSPVSNDLNSLCFDQQGHAYAGLFTQAPDFTYGAPGSAPSNACVAVFNTATNATNWGFIRFLPNQQSIAGVFAIAFNTNNGKLYFQGNDQATGGYTALYVADPTNGNPSLVCYKPTAPYWNFADGDFDYAIGPYALTLSGQYTNNGPNQFATFNVGWAVPCQITLADASSRVSQPQTNWGTETHYGTETHNGLETHNGNETHNAPQVGFNNVTADGGEIGLGNQNIRNLTDYAIYYDDNGAWWFLTGQQDGDGSAGPIILWTQGNGGVICGDGLIITNGCDLVSGVYTGNGSGLTYTFNDSTNAAIVGTANGVTNTSAKYGTLIVTGTSVTYTNFDSAHNWVFTNSSVSGQQTFVLGPGSGVKSDGGGLTCRIIFQ